MAYKESSTKFIILTKGVGDVEMSIKNTIINAHETVLQYTIKTNSTFLSAV